MKTDPLKSRLKNDTMNSYSSFQFCIYRSDNTKKICKFRYLPTGWSGYVYRQIDQQIEEKPMLFGVHNIEIFLV